MLYIHIQQQQITKNKPSTPGAEDTTTTNNQKQTKYIKCRRYHKCSSRHRSAATTCDGSVASNAKRSASVE